MTRPARAEVFETQKFAYAPALDGIRALAVIAVLLFHGGFESIAGGFLGVSVFFTLSGFLITSILLRQWGSSGSIDLTTFWTRRFRRLLPASWLTIALIVGMGAVGAWDTEQLRALRGDVPWSLGELVNWHFILGGTAYGDTYSSQSPLEHFWSLAIEQQFYVVTPLLIVALLRVTRNRPPTTRLVALRWLFVLLIAASAISNLLWAHSSIDRAYFGTDTRAAELLIGALVATFTLRTVRITRLFSRVALIAAGVGSLAILLWMFTAAELTSTWLHPWGLLACAVCTSVVLLAALQGGFVTRLLETTPLPHIGRISYGIYLLHFPIFLWFTPTRIGWSNGPLFGLQCSVTLVAALAMYNIVEIPIRERRGWFGSAKLWPALPIAAAVLIGGVVTTTDDLPPAPDFLQPRDADDVQIREVPTDDQGSTPATDPAGTGPLDSGPAQPQRVLLLGDSIAASIEDELGDALVDRGVAFATAASPGCGVIVGNPADADGNGLDVTEPCQDVIPSRQTQVVSDFQPDLVVVLSSWEAANRVYEGTSYFMGTPEADDLIRSLYEDTISRLSRSNARIVLLTIPPEVDGAIRSVSGDNNERIGTLNELLLKLSADHDEVGMIDLAEIVCPDTPCPTEVDGITLRPRDGTHFDDSVGAEWVSARIAERLLKVDVGR